MIYVWAAPRAAASDSLAQELRCSPIMIYMRSSPSPSPRGPPCAPARPQIPGAELGLGEPALGRPSSRPSSRTRTQRPGLPRSPRTAALVPGLCDNLFSSRWARGRFDFQLRAEGAYLSWGTHSVKAARGGEGEARVAPCVTELCHGGLKHKLGRDVRTHSVRDSESSRLSKKNPFLRTKNSKSEGCGCSRPHGHNTQKIRIFGVRRVRDGCSGNCSFTRRKQQRAGIAPGSASFPTLIRLVVLHQGEAGPGRSIWEQKAQVELVVKALFTERINSTT